ncbi:hypothetical protein ACLB2K_054354 [Fragaria x ananassa]
MSTNINELPDALLVEIFCRLPDYKSVSQCKYVSKHWYALMSGPSFVGRFLSLRSDHQQLQTNCTLISKSGDEFLNRMSSSSQPLRLLLKRIMSCYGLKEEPVLVCTYNDLVLCCATKFEQRDYYICNPYTIQWVPLPPAPQVPHQYSPEGFICDHPYYNSKKDDRGGHAVQLNPEYECIVMRLIYPSDQTFSSKFKVQIFSSKTGEWKESIVSSPSVVYFYLIRLDVSFAYKGMLFWGAVREGNFLIGLDPFMINSTISTNADDTVDHYTCRFIELEQTSDHYFPLRCFGEHRDCLRMCGYNPRCRVLSVRDLTEEEIHGGSVKLCMENVKKVYLLDNGLMPTDDPVRNHVLGFDPNNDDILYLQRYGDRDIFRCKVSTKEWSKIAEKREIRYCLHLRLVVPLWPTPLPRLPEHAQPILSPAPAFNLRVCSKVHSNTAAEKDHEQELLDVQHH